jgi:hypothetical protein
VTHFKRWRRALLLAGRLLLLTFLLVLLPPICTVPP